MSRIPLITDQQTAQPDNRIDPGSTVQQRSTANLGGAARQIERFVAEQRNQRRRRELDQYSMDLEMAVESAEFEALQNSEPEAMRSQFSERMNQFREQNIETIQDEQVREAMEMEYERQSGLGQIAIEREAFGREMALDQALAFERMRRYISRGQDDRAWQEIESRLNRSIDPGTGVPAYFNALESAERARVIEQVREDPTAEVNIREVAPTIARRNPEAFQDLEQTVDQVRRSAQRPLEMSSIQSARNRLGGRMQRGRISLSQYRQQMGRVIANSGLEEVEQRQVWQEFMRESGTHAARILVGRYSREMDHDEDGDISRRFREQIHSIEGLSPQDLEQFDQTLRSSWATHNQNRQQRQSERMREVRDNRMAMLENRIQSGDITNAAQIMRYADQVDSSTGTIYQYGQIRLADAVSLINQLGENSEDMMVRSEAMADVTSVLSGRASEITHSRYQENPDAYDQAVHQLMMNTEATGIDPEQVPAMFGYDAGGTSDENLQQMRQTYTALEQGMPTDYSSVRQLAMGLTSHLGIVPRNIREYIRDGVRSSDNQTRMRASTLVMDMITGAQEAGVNPVRIEDQIGQRYVTDAQQIWSRMDGSPEAVRQWREQQTESQIEDAMDLPEDQSEMEELRRMFDQYWEREGVEAGWYRSSGWFTRYIVPDAGQLAIGSDSFSMDESMRQQMLADVEAYYSRERQPGQNGYRTSPRRARENALSFLRRHWGGSRWGASHDPEAPDYRSPGWLFGLPGRIDPEHQVMRNPLERYFAAPNLPEEESIDWVYDQFGQTLLREWDNNESLREQVRMVDQPDPETRAGGTPDSDFRFTPEEGPSGTFRFAGNFGRVEELIEELRQIDDPTSERHTEVSRMLSDHFQLDPPSGELFNPLQIPESLALGITDVNDPIHQWNQGQGYRVVLKDIDANGNPTPVPLEARDGNPLAFQPQFHAHPDFGRALLAEREKMSSAIREAEFGAIEDTDWETIQSWWGIYGGPNRSELGFDWSVDDALEEASADSIMSALVDDQSIQYQFQNDPDRIQQALGFDNEQMARFRDMLDGQVVENDPRRPE